MRINPLTDKHYLTLDLLRLILLEELCIDDDRITIYNQKFIIPRKSGMFIYIEYRTPPKAISSRNKMEVDLQGNASENQNSNWLEEISIGVYSKNLDAIQRKEEVAMALHSIYSQQLQEANSFKIFRNVNIVPINEIEGDARLYRFDVECKVQSWYSKVKVAQFYDSYGVRVLVNEKPDFDLEFVIPDINPTVYPQT